MSPVCPRSAAFLLTLAAALSGCGAKLSPTPRDNYVRTIVADSSMKEVLNSKWSCSHSDAPADATLPYRRLTVFNDGRSQSIQLTVHYLDAGVPTFDLVRVDRLNCFYSSADARVLKCGSVSDPALRIETSIQNDYDRHADRLQLTLKGAASSFSVYFGGREDRHGTLSEFKQRYRDPFTILVNAPDKCGFE